MSEPTSGFVVSAEDHEKIRVLVLDRPEKLNAFTAEGYGALAGQLDAAARDGRVSVCVLTGRGRAFSAGVDLDEASRPGSGAELGARFDVLVETLARFPKPLVAAVNGPAVGFGATVLLHCDLTVVDETAQIRLPFVALGTCAEAGSSWLLPRRVGAQQASWLLLSGVTVNADEAVAAGFALARVPAGQALDHALALARQLATHDLTALVANKRLLPRGLRRRDRIGLAAREVCDRGRGPGAGTHHVARQEIGLSQRCCGLARGAISRRLGPWTSTTSPTTSTGWHPGGSRRAATPAPARPGLLVTGHWRSGSRSSAGRRSLPGWGTDWPASVRRTSRNSSDWAPDSGEAQAGLSGTELRRLSRRRGDAVAALVAQANDLALAEGQSVSDAVLEEVTATVEAALADPAAAEALQRGRLSVALRYSGLGLEVAPTAPGVSSRTVGWAARRPNERRTMRRARRRRSGRRRTSTAPFGNAWRRRRPRCTRCVRRKPRRCSG